MSGKSEKSGIEANATNRDPTRPADEVPNESDRRTAARVDLDVTVELAFATAEDVLLSRTLDISEGGAFIRMRSPRPEGTGVTLVLAVGTRTVTAEGVVVRTVAEAVAGQAPGVGVAFTRVSKEDRVFLDALVAAKLDETDGRPGPERRGATPPTADDDTSAPPARDDGDEEPRRDVLFVDDDTVILRAVSRLLTDTEFALTTAKSAEEALEILQETSFAIVVADYGLPGMDGIRFSERVRHMWPDTVLMMVSGKADLEVAKRAVNRVGCFRFMTKPFQTADLLGALRRADGHFSVTRENEHLTSLLNERNVELARVNLSLDREVHRRTAELLSGLINALDLRDTETQGHSRRVALYARRLARQLRLSFPEIKEIERGALLHDIGKIGVSDTILLKPGKLTDEERAEIEKHSLYGFGILERFEFLGEARRLVRSHHERFDGGGYPDGLAGEEIFLGARIFAVIDTYDAMTSDRPYRKALPYAVAAEELRKHSGTQFDPDCVERFVAIDKHELEAMREQVTRGESDGIVDWLIGDEDA